MKKKLYGAAEILDSLTYVEDQLLVNGAEITANLLNEESEKKRLFTEKHKMLSLEAKRKGLSFANEGFCDSWTERKQVSRSREEEETSEEEII